MTREEMKKKVIAKFGLLSPNTHSFLKMCKLPYVRDYQLERLMKIMLNASESKL